MRLSDEGRAVRPGEGRSVDLGVLSMRLLAGVEEDTGGSFALAEFSGSQGGPWTMPHLHRAFEESFYVLDGTFTFTVGEEVLEAAPGVFVLVPRGTPQAISAADGGGRFLTFMAPGGNEVMFFALGELGPDALRDPAARAAISTRFDSIPVTS
jgi:quercetin dioxygenase-like cupin family protein